MADYTSVLLVISYVVLSMATTAHCSWISGGAPPPVSVGDYVTLGDDDLIDVTSSGGDDFMIQGKDELAPAPSGDFISLEKDELAPGPSGDLIPSEKDEVTPGPAADFIIQGNGSTADGPATSGGDLIIQEKEQVPNNGENFIIQGKVYCDPCRIQFPTKISYPLPNTKITLVCHKEETGEITYTVEGLSDDKGKYTLNAVGDHANEVCEITVAESPDPNCPELMDDENYVRVSLTNKHGIKGKGRFANPLGFMVADADPRCKEALDELGFTGI